jgi:hypothetical protein
MCISALFREAQNCRDKKTLIFFFAFLLLSGKLGKQSLRIRAAKSFIFGITVFLYHYKNPMDHMMHGRQFCASLICLSSSHSAYNALSLSLTLSPYTSLIHTYLITIYTFILTYDPYALTHARRWKGDERVGVWGVGGIERGRGMASRAHTHTPHTHTCTLSRNAEDIGVNKSVWR